MLGIARGVIATGGVRGITLTETDMQANPRELIETPDTCDCKWQTNRMHFTRSSLAVKMEGMKGLIGTEVKP